MTVLGRLRKRGCEAGVLILSARDGVDDRVKGLDGGADDYLVKPFSQPELLARVRSVIRRRYQSANKTIRVLDLEIDTTARSVKRGAKALSLSAKEYNLLEYLASRQGQIVSRADIWDHVYDFASEPSSNVIDVYIGYLRKKIDHDHELKLIHTRRGLGYVLGEDS
jgi:two-component system copper resistance phosphate regulon response regulator CusR